MKRISVIALALVLVFSLAACGRRNNNETTKSTNSPDSGNTILPDMDPTMDTNIPDPEVDTQMPIYTDGTEDTSDRNDTGMEGIIGDTKR